jgi:hypothetical protein
MLPRRGETGGMDSCVRNLQPRPQAVLNGLADDQEKALKRLKAIRDTIHGVIDHTSRSARARRAARPANHTDATVASNPTIRRAQVPASA